MKKNKKKKEEAIAVGVAWYKPNQYARILELSSDRAKMHSNYLDWEKTATENTQTLIDSGLFVERVEIDVDEVLAWCEERNLPFNGSSRSKYVLQVVRQRHPGSKK